MLSLRRPDPTARIGARSPKPPTGTRLPQRRPGTALPCKGSKINPDGQLLWQTFFHGAGRPSANGGPAPERRPRETGRTAMRNVLFGIATQAVRRANTAYAHHGRISFTPAFLFHQTVCFTGHTSPSGSTVAEKRSLSGLHGHAALKSTHKTACLRPPPDKPPWRRRPGRLPGLKYSAIAL